MIFRNGENWSQRVLLFWKQKVYNSNKLYFVDGRASHAASFGTFRFLIKPIRNAVIQYKPLVS